MDEERRIRITVWTKTGNRRFPLLVSATASAEEVIQRARQKVKQRSAGWSLFDSSGLCAAFFRPGEEYFFGETPPIPAPSPHEKIVLDCPELIRAEKSGFGTSILSWLEMNAIQCPKGHAPSHVWLTPEFRPCHAFIVAPALRTRLAALNADADTSFLIEMRRGICNLHFDFDIMLDCHDEPVFESAKGYWNGGFGDALKSHLSREELDGLVVTGSHGPWRGKTKIGFHIYCKRVIVDESGLRTRTNALRDVFPDSLDVLTGGGMRAFGSKSNCSCKECRKRKKVNPKCLLCFGRGKLPERQHVLIEKAHEDLVASIYPEMTWPLHKWGEFDLDSISAAGQADALEYLAFVN